jgi:hypothetical protein
VFDALSARNKGYRQLGIYIHCGGDMFADQLICPQCLDEEES